MLNHTPGPWSAFIMEDTMSVHACKNTQGNGGDEIVTWVGFDGSPFATMDCKANARLMAAAPEMLDLLRQVAKCSLFKVRPVNYTNILIVNEKLADKINELLEQLDKEEEE